MPVQPTYPGVYVQEVPSGVHTITGVSTSVTAFLGVAKRGPIDKAVTITSFIDFEKRFGGLSAESEMSFAVRQFFLNGGTQGIIVRVAKDAHAAVVDLDSDTVLAVLHIQAVDAGTEGNNIEVRVNPSQSNSASYFDLSLFYSVDANPSNNVTEKFFNLSMNKSDARFVEDMVNDISKLVRVTRNSAVVTGLTAGHSTSGAVDAAVTDLNHLVDATHNQFRVVVDGGDPINITINPATDIGPTPVSAQLTALATSLAPKLGAVATASATATTLTITSTSTSDSSRVRILSGAMNDAAGRLKLGVINGGTEVDAVSTITPRAVPAHGTLTSGAIALPATGVPVLNDDSFRISIDQSFPVTIQLTGAPLTALADVAAAIQSAVRSKRSGSLAFSAFTCRVSGSTLVLSSGTTGSHSSVVVSAVPGNNLASDLHLLIDGSATTAVATAAADVMLAGGTEFPVAPTDEFDAYTGSQAARTGMYALEGVDIFNILCLPGITNPGILSECDAYCRARRAFLIADAPPESKKPEDMVASILGTGTIKSDYAAIYYPWVRIANPLNGGALRTSAPSGTLAGLYARIDSNRGVWKAPAGTEASMLGVRMAEYHLTDGENGLLNPHGVNCIRVTPDAGTVSWGARTLAGADSLASEWKYIPVRRTALFIEESLYRGLKWVVFEPNDEPLWAQIRLNVGAFMHRLFTQGAFQGKTKKDAYFVKCDDETTTQNDIDLGIVNIWVGFAPLKPAEFVILYLQQMAGNIQV